MPSPNPRLQRTRLRAPLSRKPFGDLALLGVLALAAAVGAAAGSSTALGSELLTPVSVQIPHFPEVAVRARMEGRVELEITVDGQGLVAGVEVLKSVNPLLDSACRRALERWAFQGAGQLHVTVQFVLWNEGDEYCLPGPAFQPPEMITVYGYPLPVVLTRT